MRYQVPQNIDMEDKIIGPLTMAQFLYLMVGGMVIYLAYLTLIPIAFLAVLIPVGLFVLALAFIKIQDQPFPKFIGATLLYLVRAKSRVWQKDPSASHLAEVVKRPSTPEQKSPPQTIPHGEIETFAQALDTGVVPTPQTSGIRHQASVDIPQPQTGDQS